MAGSAMCDKNPFVNPNGIASFSPGLARVREGLPWVAAFTFHNPERVEYQRLMKQIQPLQGCDFSRCSPRVARSSQPWAECFNPVGIEKPMSPLQTSPGIPPKTSRNPVLFSDPAQRRPAPNAILRKLYGQGPDLIVVVSALCADFEPQARHYTNQIRTLPV